MHYFPIYKIALEDNIHFTKHDYYITERSQARMARWTRRTSGVGFAFPSNRVATIVPQIISSGSVIHIGSAALGVQVADVDANLTAKDNLSVDHGASVATVVQNGAAAAAWIQKRKCMLAIVYLIAKQHHMKREEL